MDRECLTIRVHLPPEGAEGRTTHFSDTLALTNLLQHAQIALRESRTSRVLTRRIMRQQGYAHRIDLPSIKRSSGKAFLVDGPMGGHAAALRSCST
jgi:hypothetical protein